MAAVGVNGVLGFVMLVTLCFTLGDVNSILSSATGFPFIQIFYNTTQSYVATDIMTAILVVTLTASSITEVATASRQLWSFARDQGVPFSSVLQYVRYNFFKPFLFAERCADVDDAGHSRMEHPPKRSPGLPRRYDPPLPDQHRLHRGPQRHHLPHHHLPDLILPHLHRLRPAEAAPRPTLTPASLVTRPLRHGDKHGRDCLPNPHIHFRLLPAKDPCQQGEHELEYCHVRGDDPLRDGVLLGQGTTQLHTACSVGEERVSVSLCPCVAIQK